MIIAFWCVLVAALLPYAPLGLVKGADPNLPRGSVLTGASARAHGAHLNAFEAFGPFAAAVIISHLTLGANSWSNILAVLFLVARLAHMGFYIAGIAPLRSAAFFAGALIVVAMFIHAGVA